MTADALRLDGLRVQASGRTLLDGIDLAIPERGLFGIVGPNGSGKTTLLRAALGLVRPREGRVALLGRALDQWKPAELARHIGYVAQQGHQAVVVRNVEVGRGLVGHQQ
ncbi:ATP-binding cassette domain-containing protein, partial [Variovorax sp. CT11-76]